MNKIAKKQYAKEIAALVGGNVIEEKKTDDVTLTGIIIMNGAEGLVPIVYIDDFYAAGVSPEEVAKKILDIYEKNRNIDSEVSWLMDYSQIAPYLTMRLQPESIASYLAVYAEEFGFPDLVLIPYVSFIHTQLGPCAVAVSEELMESWGVSEQEMINRAMQNLTYEIIPMPDMIREYAGRMGIGFPDAAMPKEAPDMYVVTNASRHFGAASIIPAREKLERIFPEGYIVIPLSVDECVVRSAQNVDEKKAQEIINMLSVTDSINKLSNKIYYFTRGE